MKLYFNGCSHTAGDDLLEPNKTAWPAVLSNSLGCEFLNDAVSGGTNDRTIYRVIKNIDLYDKFYIAWTYTNRFTHYRRDNNYEVTYNINLYNDMFKTNPDFIDYGNLHYKLFHNELFHFKLWLQQIILLQSYLKGKNKKYVMINAAHNFLSHWTADWGTFNSEVKDLLCFDIMDDDQLHNEHLEIKHLVEQIDFTHYLGWKNFTIHGLYKSFPLGPTRHLLEDGQRAIADYILQNDSN